jgi:hypothetical protein
MRTKYKPAVSTLQVRTAKPEGLNQYKALAAVDTQSAVPAGIRSAGAKSASGLQDEFEVPRVLHRIVSIRLHVHEPE